MTGTPWDATNGPTNDAVFNLASLNATVSGTIFTNGVTFSTAGTVSSGTITLAGTTPTITATAAGTINSTLAGTAGFTKAGTTTLTLGADNSAGLSGTITVSAGGIMVGNTVALGGTADGTTVASGARVQFNNLATNSTVAEPFTIAGTGISSGGALNVGNNKTVTLSGLVTLSAAAEIQADGGSAFNLSGGVSSTGNHNLTFQTDGSVTSSIGNSLNLGTGTLIKTGGSRLDVGAASATLGGITVSSGTLRINNAGSLPATATISLPKAGTNSGTLQVNMAGPNTFTNAFGGFASSNGLANGGTPNIQNVTGSNTFSGTMTVTSGGGNGVNFQSDAGTLTISGTLGVNFTTGGTRIFSFGGAGSGIFSGQMNNNAVSADGVPQFVKLGSGTWSITGTTNNFTGGVIILAGTLDAASLANSGSASSLGSGGAISLAGQGTSGTLRYSGSTNQSSNRAINVSATGGTLDASGAGTLSLSGTLTAADQSAFNLNYTNGQTTATNTAQSAPGVGVGMTVTATGLPAGTTITAISGNSYTLSNAFTGTTGAVSTSFSSPSRVLTLTGTNTGANTLSASMANASGGGTLAVNKTGTGTWVLSGASTYTGTTSIAGGTLRLSGGNNRLPATGTVAFTGSGTFDVGATSQTLAGLTTPDNAAVTLGVTGASGSLTVNAGNLQIGPGGAVASTDEVTMTFAGLSTFTYTNSSGSFRVGLKSAATNSNPLGQVATATLAASNSITATLIGVGDTAASNDGGISTLSLGQANTINANTINIGNSGRSDATLQFAAGLSAPTATIRGTSGGTTPVANWLVGNMAQFDGASQTSFTASVDLSAGTTDALATVLRIGSADITTAANRRGTQTSTFTMGAGTLSVGTLRVGYIASQASATVAAGGIAANGTLTLDSASGTVIADSLLLAENAYLGGTAGPRTVSGTVNLSAGTLRAGSIALGPQTGSVTSATTAFNWTGGTLGNRPGQNLAITDVPLALASGTGTFDATGSNSITVSATSPISGSGGLAKTGTGRLVLSAANTYGGPTAVNAGSLLVNGNQSAAAGAVSVATGATLGGTGTIGGATAINGTHSPGASPGLQTFINGLAYASTGTLVWELSANTALLADRGVLYDGIDLTTAGALAIDPAATFSLIFDQPLTDATPSTVAWSDPFWNSAREWTIASVAAPVTWDGTWFGTLTVGADSTGAALSAARPSASFSLANDSGNLMLQYAPVPEPGAVALVTIGLAAGWVARRRAGRR